MRGKKGFTIVELAAVVAVFLIMLAALGPFVHIAKVRKARIDCAGNIMKISLALHSYSAEHDGVFPPRLGDLYSNYITDEKVFDCPTTKNIGTKDKPEYIYTTGRTELSPPKEIIVQDADGNHKKSGKNIARINGSVEWLGTAR